MTQVLSDFAQGSVFEVVALVPHLGCLTNSTSRLFEPYLFSGSSSSSAAHEGPECSSSPTKIKQKKRRKKIPLFKLVVFFEHRNKIRYYKTPKNNTARESILFLLHNDKKYPDC